MSIRSKRIINTYNNSGVYVHLPRGDDAKHLSQLCICSFHVQGSAFSGFYTFTIFKIIFFTNFSFKQCPTSIFNPVLDKQNSYNKTKAVDTIARKVSDSWIFFPITWHIIVNEWLRHCKLCYLCTDAQYITVRAAR